MPPVRWQTEPLPIARLASPFPVVVVAKIHANVTGKTIDSAMSRSQPMKENSNRVATASLFDLKFEVVVCQTWLPKDEERKEFITCGQCGLNEFVVFDRPIPSD